MFASYADYSKTSLITVNKKYINVAAPAMTLLPAKDAVLSFVDYVTKRSITNYGQNTRVFLAFTWTNGTTEGYCKGLNFIRETVQRIFVKRRLSDQWRLSKLS